MNYRAKEHYQDKEVAESYYEKRFRSFKGRADHYLEKLFLKNSVHGLKIESALDVACGTGRMTKELLLMDIPVVFGSDISQEMLDTAARYCETRNDPPVFKKGDATDLPFEDDTFDLVISFRFLDHLPKEEKEQALSEMARVSKRYIMFSMANIKTWTKIAKKIRNPFNKKGYEGYLVKESDILSYFDKEKIKIIRKKLKFPLLSMELIYFCEV